MIPPFLPPSNFEPWNSDRSRLLREGKSEAPRLPMPPQRKLNSSGNSDIVSVCSFLPFSIIHASLDVFSLSLLYVRRLSVVWLAGPLSFPASPRGPPPPLLQTLVTTTPPTPQEAPMEWQESTGTLTTAQVYTNTVKYEQTLTRWDISNQITYSYLFLPPGGSADSVLSQIAAQRKRAAGLIDVKAQAPEKQHSQTQSHPSLPPSAPGLPLPDISLPDIHSHPSLVASDIHSRRVCLLFPFCYYFGNCKTAKVNKAPSIMSVNWCFCPSTLIPL